MPADLEPPYLNRGQMLIQHDRRTGRFELWTVTSARRLKSGKVSAKLLSGSKVLAAEASATFPADGLTVGKREGWKVFDLNQADRALCFERLAPAPEGEPEGDDR